ncbi:MAG: DUF6089 family protein [Leeuwenhoekiella sp.]
MKTAISAAIVFLCLAAFSSYCQTFEGGLYIGGANYLGEIGPKETYNPKIGVVGGIFKYHLNERFALRSSISIVPLSADDRDATGFRGNGRGKNIRYRFYTNILDGMVGAEFVPFRIWLSDYTSLSPYLFGGIGVFYGDELYLPERAPVSNALSYDKQVQVTFPVGLGLKMPVSDRLQLGLEVAPRFLTTDNLDGGDAEPPFNENNDLNYFQGNDLYVVTAFTITYFFGNDYGSCNCR